jgi:mannosylglycerate hydrolase
MELPFDLEARKARLLNGSTDFEFVVELRKNDPVVHFSSTIDNKVNDHRLRVYVPTNVPSTHSIADQQFGTIERPVYDTAQDVWEEEKWKEKPVDIYSMMTYVGLSNENHGLSLFTKGIREYEIVGEQYDTIALTLMRGVGVLGKEKLYYRPGRPSGIKMPTPDSQMIGKYTFEFGLFSHELSTEEARVTAKANDYLTPNHTYHENSFNAMKLNLEDKSLKASTSLFTLNNDEVVLSVVKKAENENGIVIRLFNPSRVSNVNATLKFNENVASAHLLNLNEDQLHPMEVASNEVCLESILPCHPVTILVNFN